MPLSWDCDNKDDDAHLGEICRQLHCLGFLPAGLNRSIVRAFHISAIESWHDLILDVLKGVFEESGKTNGQLVQDVVTTFGENERHYPKNANSSPQNVGRLMSGEVAITLVTFSRFAYCLGMSGSTDDVDKSFDRLFGAIARSYATDQQIANILDIDRSTVSRWISGERLTLRDFIALARLVPDISMSQFEIFRGIFEIVDSEALKSVLLTKPLLGAMRYVIDNFADEPRETTLETILALEAFRNDLRQGKRFEPPTPDGLDISLETGAHVRIYPCHLHAHWMIGLVSDALSIQFLAPESSLDIEADIADPKLDLTLLCNPTRSNRGNND